MKELGLNKSNGNMYEEVTHTWNPLGGKCQHDCIYCYVKSIPYLQKYKGEYTIHDKEFVNLGKNNFIFICNCTDLFEKNVPSTYIKRIIDHIKKYPNNRYLIQTKNPKRISKYINGSNAGLFMFDDNNNNAIPDNWTVCTTIETNRNTQLGNAPSVRDRAEAMSKLKGSKAMTIEPIVDFDIKELLNIIDTVDPEWIWIGADSKRNHLKEPSKEKLKELIERIKKKHALKLKHNINRLL